MYPSFVLSPELGTESESILDMSEVLERRCSIGELDAEPPAVEGLPALGLTRVIDGEEGRPMNIPECRFDSGMEAFSVGDPSSCDDER